MFGSWTKATKEYAQKFQDAKPFEHVILPEFFETNFAERIAQQFPSPNDSRWHVYHNPIERKKAMNQHLPHLLEELYTNTLVHPDFVQLIRDITQIDNLEVDPHRHGAGCHLHGNKDLLQLHLDYMIHPLSGQERRVNLIIYMTEDWKDEYGGHLELWSATEGTELTPKKCEQRIMPSFNQAVLFKTSDLSWHGLPHPISCPPNLYRKSIAIYYVSERRKHVEHPRLKAFFVPLPNELICDGLKKLYEIRATRLLTQEDLMTYVPQWVNEQKNGVI